MKPGRKCFFSIILSAVALPAALLLARPHFDTYENSVSLQETTFESMQNGSADNSPSNPTPTELRMGWMQFHSFLLKWRSQLNGAPAGQFDPAWLGRWHSKESLGLSGPPGPCQPGAAGFPARSPTPSDSDNENAGFEVPFQLKSNSQPCNLMADSVLYNDVASRYILYRHLNDRKALRSLPRKIAQQAEGDISFPVGSVIIKEIWERLTPVSNGKQIAVWSPINPNFQKAYQRLNPSFNSVESWEVRASLTSGPCSQRTYFFDSDNKAPQGSLRHPNVPPACFISIPSGPSDYLLVGLNVARMTRSGWHWFAFAWSSYLPSSDDSTAVYPGGWYANPQMATGKAAGNVQTFNHYLMSMTNVRMDSKNRYCFNPYLEALSGNGLQTNCTRCHQFANLRGDTSREHPTSSQYMSPTTGFNPQWMTKEVVNTRLKETLPTGFLWSLMTPYER